VAQSPQAEGPCRRHGGVAGAPQGQVVDGYKDYLGSIFSGDKKK
jgi:hypothetical protein